MYYTAIFVAFSVMRFVSGLRIRQSDSWTPYYGAILFLFFFVGFRDEVGCDWVNYLRHYNLVDYEGLAGVNSIREPLYWLLLDILTGLGLEYYALNVVTAAVFFIGLAVFANSQPERLSVALLSFPVLVMNIPMSATRQALALGFIMIALVYLFRGRRLGYVLLVLIASGFHSSAVIMLPIVMFVGVKNLRRAALWSVVLLAPLLFLVSGSTEDVGVDIYIERYVGTGVEAFGGIFRIVFVSLFAGFYLVVLRRRWIRENPQEALLYTLFCLAAIALIPLAFFSSVIADRINYYLMPVQLAIVARIPYLLRNKEGAFLYLSGAYLAFGVFFVVWTMTSSHFRYCYAPYQTYLF